MAKQGRGLPDAGAPIAPARAMAVVSVIFCVANAVGYVLSVVTFKVQTSAQPAPVCLHHVMVKKGGLSWLQCGPHAPQGPSEMGLAAPGDAWLWTQNHWQLVPGGMTGAARLALGLPLMLNLASASELAHVPGLGTSLAKKVVADRAANGFFSAPSDLLRVRGLGPGRVAAAQASLVVMEKEVVGARR